LQRAQFTQLSTDLRSAEGEVQHEVVASRGAWPPIAPGLPRALPAPLQQAVHAASLSAEALREPAFIRNAGKLTGPAAGIAGIYENYEQLAKRGWRLTEATIDAMAGATPAASFERQNSPLYIDAIYDGHFDLSLLGKALVEGYGQLGGPSAFGAKLSQRELDALATAYSIPAVRLEPHPVGTIKER
jgi:hypothetical protein